MKKSKRKKLPIPNDLAGKVKRANERLRQIERTSNEEKSASYRYVRRQYEGKSRPKYLGTTKAGEIKFRTDLTKITNLNTLKALESHVDFFLNQASSSKVSNINKAYKKGFESFKKRTGFQGTQSEFDDLWKDKRYKELIKAFGVSDAIEVMYETMTTFDLDMDEALEELYKEQEKTKVQRYDDIRKRYNLSKTKYKKAHANWKKKAGFNSDRRIRK